MELHRRCSSNRGCCWWWWGTAATRGNGLADSLAAATGRAAIIRRNIVRCLKSLEGGKVAAFDELRVLGVGPFFHFCDAMSLVYKRRRTRYTSRAVKLGRARKRCAVRFAPPSLTLTPRRSYI